MISETERKIGRKIRQRCREGYQEQIAQCIKKVGSEFILAIIGKLNDPERFLKSIEDIDNPENLLAKSEVIKHGKINPTWAKVVNSVPAHLIFSVLELDPKIWNESGLTVLKKLSSLDKVLFEEVTKSIQKQIIIYTSSEAIFKIWAKRPPEISAVLDLTDYIKGDHNRTFVESVLPRLDSRICLSEAIRVGAEIKTDNDLLRILTRLPKNRDGKVNDIKTIEELLELLFLAKPINFKSEESKKWCLNGIIQSALLAYGKLPSIKSLEELIIALEVIFEKNPNKVLGENPKKFLNGLGTNVILGLNLISRRLKQNKNTSELKFAEDLERTLNPFLSGIKWNKKPSMQEKIRALRFYLFGLSADPQFMGIAGTIALNSLLRAKSIEEITPNQFKKLFLRYVSGLKELGVNSNEFKWNDSLYPLFAEYRNWKIKKTALHEILVYYAPDEKFVRKAVVLVAKYPSISGVSEIVEAYKDRSLEVVEAVYKKKVQLQQREKLIKAIAEAKPKNIERFIETVLFLDGSVLHLSWRLDEERNNYKQLKESSALFSIEEGEKLARIVSPFLPEIFSESFRKCDPVLFERAFRLLKVVVNNEETLSEALMLIATKETEPELLLNWLTSQNYISRKRYLDHLFAGKGDSCFHLVKLANSPFGLLGNFPAEVSLGEKTVLGKMKLTTAIGEGGLDFLKTQVPKIIEEIKKDDRTLKIELIEIISKKRSDETTIDEALEIIANSGKRIKNPIKTHLIEATLNLSRNWGNISDYKIALMTEKEVRDLLIFCGLEGTSRFSKKIQIAAKSRYERRINKEEEYFKEILSNPLPEVPDEPEEDFYRQLARRYAPPAEGQEYNSLRFKKLYNKRVSVSHEGKTVDELVFEIVHKVGKLESFYEFKCRLQELVNQQPSELIGCLQEKLFLNEPKNRVDQDESYNHIAKLSWMVRLNAWKQLVEIIDDGVKGNELVNQTLATRIISLYPGIRYLRDNPLLIREAILRVCSILSEELGENIKNQPVYKTESREYEVLFRRVEGSFIPLLTCKQKPDSYGLLTAQTLYGEKVLALVALKGELLVGITPSSSLLYSGKIPLKATSELTRDFKALRSQIFDR